MRETDHEKEVDPPAPDSDQRLDHFFKLVIVIIFSENFPYVDIVRFGRYFDIKVLDAVGRLSENIGGGRPEKLDADLILDACLLHGFEKPVAVLAAGLEQIPKDKDRGARKVGNPPDVIGDEFRGPEAGALPPAHMIECGYRSAAGAAVMVAAPDGKDGRHGIVAPVFERNVARRVAIFNGHFEEMRIIKVNVIEVLRLE
jgi:hypothetical protein